MDGLPRHERGGALRAGAGLLPVGGVFDLVAGALDRAVDRFAGPLEGAFAIARGQGDQKGQCDKNFHPANLVD